MQRLMKTYSNTPIYDVYEYSLIDDSLQWPEVQWREFIVVDYKYDPIIGVEGPIRLYRRQDTLTYSASTWRPCPWPNSYLFHIDEWHFQDQLAQGHITLNCVNVAGLGVKTTGTAKEAWDSIQAEWGKSTDMHRSHAQELLNKAMYAEGASVQDHIKLLRTRKAAVNNLSTSMMSNETWWEVIISSGKSLWP